MLNNKTKFDLFLKDMNLLTTEVCLKLRKLTLPDGGSGMNTALTDFTYKFVSHRATAFIAVEQISKEWIGWCLAQEERANINSFMVFVRPENRLQGIGQQLVSVATSSFGKSSSGTINECFPWDVDSALFFGKTVTNCKIDLYDFYLKEKIVC